MSGENEEQCFHTGYVEAIDGFLTCFKCWEILRPLFVQGYSSNHVFRKRLQYPSTLISPRLRSFNKTLKKMFPGVIIPDGSMMIRDIEKRYEQLDEKVGSFPSMKVVIYCMLIKCGMNDLAKTITLPKSDSSQKLLKKLLKNNENTSE